VLRPGGALVVTTPTERHLVELVERLGLLTVDERKHERLATALHAHLVLERREEHEWPLELTPGDVANAVAMGPSARHATRAETGTAGTAVTASVTISTYRAGSG
jgi:23S rRNA (guanine745-N1)-methyltransferase